MEEEEEEEEEEEKEAEDVSTSMHYQSWQRDYLQNADSE